MDFKTNIEEEDNIWDIITNIHGELEYIQNVKNQYGELLRQLNELEGVLLDEGCIAGLANTGFLQPIQLQYNYHQIVFLQ